MLKTNIPNENVDLIIINSIVYKLNENNQAIIVDNLLDAFVDLILPETIEYKGKSYPVVAIGRRAFFFSRYLSSIKISDSVQEIFESAFEGSDLRNISLPKDIVIHSRICCECIYLTDVTIEDGIKTIPEMAFFNCISMQNFSIPRSVETIKSAAFKECFRLCHVDFNDGLEIIEELSFYGTNLSYVHIGGFVKEVGELAFGEIDQLKTLVIENTNVKFGDKFITNENRVTIYLKAQLGSDFEQELREMISKDHYYVVDEFRFFEDEGVSYMLFELNVGRAITYHSKRISPNTIICNHVSDWIITDYQPGVFRGAKRLKTVTFPDSIVRLRFNIFSGCSNLEEVRFPYYIDKDEAKRIVNNDNVNIVIEKDPLSEYDNNELLKKIKEQLVVNRFTNSKELMGKFTISYGKAHMLKQQSMNLSKEKMEIEIKSK